MSFTFHCCPAQYDVERSSSDETEHQAAFSPWIVRILLQQFSMLDNCRFDLREVKILLQPFLLGMEADFILPISKEALDLTEIHNAFYATATRTSTGLSDRYENAPSVAELGTGHDRRRKEKICK